MKKVLLIAVTLISISSMSSCKKDWICTCTYSTTGDKTEYPIANSRRPEASLACDFYEGFGEDCSLK